MGSFSAGWPSVARRNLRLQPKTESPRKMMEKGRTRPEPRRWAKPTQQLLRAFLARRQLSGLFHHCQLAQHLVRAGFEVGRIEKENNHAHVWVLRLRQGQVPAGQAIDWLKKQVCLFLKRRGIRYPRKEVGAMVQGDRIKAAFNWEAGAPGYLICERKSARKGKHS